MPFCQKLDGNDKKKGNIRNNSRDRNCLTPKQTEYIYKKVELGGLINKDTIKEEIDSDADLDKRDNNSGDENPYKELIVNNGSKIENTLSQMEQWSILSNIINYVQYSKTPKNFHNVIIKPVNNSIITKGTKNRSIDESSLRVDLASILDESREEYLDRYEGIASEILNTTRFNENSDLSTTFLGKSHVTREDNLMIEEKFSITEQGYMVGKLLDGTECQILLDTGASKSFMSKSHYLHCKSLHSFPMFASKTQRIQVGNRQYVSVLFVIPIIIDIHGHRFKIYTLVSEIHENVDIVLGIKNVFKLEGVINSWECCFSFLNRSVPIFPKEKIILKQKEQKLVKVEAPFSDEISGLAIVNLLDKSTHSAIVLKVKFAWNIAMLDMMNSISEILILNLKEALGILDLRS